jgi:hypothetical protein
MRRAAARACVLRKDTDRVPELIRLLRDADAGVARAAHAAPKELSGRDCGPSDDTSPEQRRQAATAWLAWWTSRSAPAK